MALFHAENELFTTIYLDSMFKKLRYSGIKPEHPVALARCIEITNVFNVVFFFLVVPFIILFRESVYAALISTTPMFLHVISFHLVRTGFHKTGRFIFSITSVLAVYFVGSFIFMDDGTEGMAAKFLMMGAIIIPFIVFQASEWLMKAVAVLIGFICIMTFDSMNEAVFFSLDKNLDTPMLRNISIIVCYFMLSGMLFYHSWKIGLYHHEIVEYTADLNKKNQQISDQNKALEENIRIIQKKDEQKSVLMRETHHRVKNNFQVIISLLRLQESQLKNKEDVAVFKDAEDRIATMALLHEKIYRSEDLKLENTNDYFTNLVNSLIRSYEMGKTISLNISVDKTNFGVNTLVPLSLIVNEAVSNSLKHAFKTRDHGTITLQLSHLTGDNYELIIGDDGTGLSPEHFLADKSTMGIEIIKTFTDQLDGEIELMEREGTFYKISFKAIDQHNGGVI